MVVLTSFTQPTDGIRHRQNNTTVYVNDNNLGKGTLFIAESRLSWVSDSGNGFSIEYPYISLHAISRDLNAFPQECLFLMLDTTLGDEETNNGENENGENDMANENGSETETTEIRIVPDDRGMLDAMFHAMNACQALHPDPEDSFSDEDFYEDADDEIPMEEADHRMAGLHIGDTEAEVEGNILHTLEGVGVGRVPEGLASSVIRNTSWGRGVAVEVDRGVGIGADMEGWEEEEEEVLEGSAPSLTRNTWVGGAVERGVGTAADMEVGNMVVDMEVGSMAADRVGDMGVDRVVGRAVGILGVDRVAGRVADRVEGRVADRAVGTLSVDRMVERAVGRPMVHMARGDISFSAGSNSYQGNRALLQSAHRAQQDSQENHFDDAEN